MKTPRPPFSDIIDATFWGLGGILSIIAIQAITAAICETRKVVIQVSAQRLNQAPPTPGQPNLGQWDPYDPFRPRF